MNTPNPLVPQGALQELKSKSHIRIAVCTILAIHVVVIIGLLIAGCKRETGTAENQAATNRPPVFDAASASVDSNTVAQTNPIQTQANNLIASQNPVTNQPTSESISAGTTEYTVAKGDSFYTIGKKLGVPTKAIAAANTGVDSTKLKVGQKLQIPAKPAGTVAAEPTAPEATGTTGAGGDTVYVVKSGDNLTKIAKAHGTTPKSLRAANALKTDQIKVGQKLKIPSKASTQETAAPPSAAGGTGTNL